MVVSEQIIRAVTNTGDVAAGVPERAWLMAHGVRAILTFRFYVSDNSKAPERSLGAGRLEALT